MSSPFARWKRSTPAKVITAAVLVFAALVVIANVTADDDSVGRAANRGSAGTANDEVATDRVARHLDDDPRALGDVDAPLVVVEWIDLRCPFCALFHRQTLPDLIEDYVDVGQVRYEVHDIAIFEGSSLDGATAVRAAAEQGLYHEYLNAVYEAAPDDRKADITRPFLLQVAEQVAIPDMAAFESVLDNPDRRREVQADTVRAQRMGVNSVPFFLIGDTVLSGAQPADTFRDAIDEQLALR